MKTIKTYYGQPILDIYKVKRALFTFTVPVPLLAGKEVDFGVFRDRQPDANWGEISQVNFELCGERIKETELTEELRVRLLGDLAYVYGKNTIKFEQKLKEFNLWNLS